MKILYIYKDYYPVKGGIENYTRQLAEGMLERGHGVEVLATNPGFSSVNEVINGVPVLKAGRWLNVSSAPISPGLTLHYLKRLLSNRVVQPDIVHLQFPYPPAEVSWLFGSYIPLVHRPRTILTYHSDVVRQRRLLAAYRPFLRQVLRRVDMIVPTSPAYMHSSPFLQPVLDKCRVIPLGVDSLRWSQATARQMPAISGPVILFVGRLRYYKGLSYLLAAMPDILKDAHLVIVGSGPEEGSLRLQTTELNLNNRVHFVGEVSETDLPGYYAAADLFVLPACERSEAFGMVQLEAMAAGKAVISTELGTGTSFANQDGQTGLVVPPANPAALASAINQLLNATEWRLEMGQRGQARVQAEFSLPLMCSKLEALYLEALNTGIRR